LPITTSTTPGAYGSLWSTEIWYRAESAAAVFPLAIADVMPQAKTTVPLPVFRVPPGRPPGQFIYVTRAAADGIRINLRIQDLSRQSQTWGTEIPVVREQEFFDGPITLIHVPTDSRFRQALRIYDAGGEGSGRVMVRIFPSNGQELLGEEELPLPVDGLPIYSPGYAQIVSVADRFPAVVAASIVRIEITPLTASTRLWAFVSVTNNETQHVTTITAQ
ncbi:MAG TPA: hypothetical protein VF698_14895, partial [Thermoanaerobaculia bacterium]